MWKIVKLETTGQWTVLGKENDVETSKKKASELAKDLSDIFFFYDAPIPSDKESQNKIAKEVFDANDGKILRMTIGAKVSDAPNKDEITSCGRCFCVVYTNGVRQCEGSYCNENGYCWWVVCSSGC